MNNLLFHSFNTTQTHLADYVGEHITTDNKPPCGSKLENVKIIGRSEQNGIPTPEIPVPIQNVPSEFDITSCGKNLHNYENTYSVASGSATRIANGYRVEGNVTEDMAFHYNRGWFYSQSSVEFLSDASVSLYLPVGQYRISADVKLTEMRNTPYIRIYLRSAARHLTTTNSLLLSLDQIVRVHQNYNITIAGWYTPNFGINSNIVEITNVSVNTGTDGDYTPYIGTTTPFQIKDTDDNLHELCSLPNGTADSIENGEIIKRVREKRFSYPQEISLTTYTNKWKVATVASGFIEIMHDDTEDGWGFIDSSPSIYGMCNLFKFIRLTSRVNLITTAAKRTSNTRLRIWLAIEELGVDETTPIEEVSEAFSVWFNNLLQTKGDLIYLLETSTAQPYPLQPDEYEKLDNLYPLKLQQNNIFTTATVQPTLDITVRKVGNKPYVEHSIKGDNNTFLVDENNNKIGGQN